MQYSSQYSAVNHEVPYLDHFRFGRVGPYNNLIEHLTTTMFFKSAKSSLTTTTVASPKHSSDFLCSKFSLLFQKLPLLHGENKGSKWQKVKFYYFDSPTLSFSSSFIIKHVPFSSSSFLFPLSSSPPLFLPFKRFRSQAVWDPHQSDMAHYRPNNIMFGGGPLM